MNPLFSCCAYYCSGIAIVGIFFYAVLLVFLATNNKYLLFEEEKHKSDRITAVGIAIGVNIFHIIFTIFT